MLRDPTHLFEGKISDKQMDLAKALSMIFQPIFISIPVFIALSTLTGNVVDTALISFVCILFSVILPVIEIGYFSKKTNNTGLDIVKREDRIVPLVIAILMYLTGTVAVYLLNAPNIVCVLMLAYTINTFIVLLISTKWKISLHAIGFMGPSMSLMYSFGPIGAILLIPLPFVCWSRYVQRKHTPAQLVGGIILGVVLTSIIFAFML